MKQTAMIAVFVLLLTGCSSTHVVNPVDDNAEAAKLEKEKAYQDGYKQAEKDLKERYITEGYRRAEKIIGSYAARIKAYEAGKYAMKENLVTYPVIVGVDQPDGTVEIKSLGCEIKKELTPEELMAFYKKNADIIPSIGAVEPSGRGQKPARSHVVEKVSQPTKRVYRSFTKSYTNREVIESYGIQCEDAGNEYQCRFRNEAEFRDFCKETSICKE